ncbi:MAG: asparagine synthase (glutamine-hydrolyzing) [Gemmatimonadetes bacterium]|nr:asparagine synthase (glutamine-hydrolyzing) [Gemmatimonadota bacterium]
MCGIAGAVALSPSAAPRREVVEEMSRCIAHRGPDGEGLWTSPTGRVMMAHRRLAIIDLATGDQPQFSPDGRFALVFNGEIYNYKELRAELERDGCAFRTQSDTEVLLHLIAREGDACVERLRGMFCFAAWDRSEQLLVARDRVGKKPFYWSVRDGIFYFASSLEAVHAALGAPRTLDMAALDDYLTLGWVPAPRTIFAGIHKLEPSVVMTLDQHGAHSRVYWDLAADRDPFEGSLDDAADALLPMLREATRIRLRADVPLGIFLSGGIDSSLVTAMAMQEDATLHTYSIRFDDVESDERLRGTRGRAPRGLTPSSTPPRPRPTGSPPSSATSASPSPTPRRSPPRCWRSTLGSM